MPFSDFNGAEIHYDEVGRGELVVLLHTGPGRCGDWRGVTSILKNEMRCLAPDLYFRGQSSEWLGPGDYSLDGEATMCAFLIKARAQRAHIVGHSYGGAVATRLAVMEPQLVKTLTLIEPQNVRLLDLAGETEVFNGLCEIYRTFIADMERGCCREAWRRFIDFYNEDGRWQSLPQTAQSRILRLSDKLSVMWKALCENPTTLQDLSAIGAKTLIIVGEQTTEPDGLICKILDEHMPHSRTVKIDGARHMSPVTHPDRVATAIAQHVKTGG